MVFVRKCKGETLWWNTIDMWCCGQCIKCYGIVGMKGAMNGIVKGEIML